MLIELGPTTLLRGRDWFVVLHTIKTRRVVASFTFFLREQRYSGQVRHSLVVLAARVYGFDVTADGLITNWDEVPHLWEGNTRVD